MKNIALKLTNLLIRWELVDEKYQDWCRYMLERKLMSLGAYISIFFVSIYTGEILETCIFTFSFIFLRQRTGGYHANHAVACLSISTALAAFVPIMVAIINNINWMYHVLILISIYGVFYKFAPINHPNMRMNQKEILANKKVALKNLLILIFLSITLKCVNFVNLSSGIVYGIYATAISIIIAKILKQEE